MVVYAMPRREVCAGDNGCPLETYYNEAQEEVGEKDMVFSQEYLVFSRGLLPGHAPTGTCKLQRYMALLPSEVCIE